VSATPPRLARGAVGDPQLKTDHPWYPGELSCSTFERLFKTQAELYRRVTGRSVDTDEDKALASWYWRNLHYAHGEEGGPDCFGNGLRRGKRPTGTANTGPACSPTASACAARPTRNTPPRSTACSATAAGGASACRGTTVLKSSSPAAPYGAGRWALLEPRRLHRHLHARRLRAAVDRRRSCRSFKTLQRPAFKPDRQRGWRVSRPARRDAAVYTQFNSVEYLSGYAGPPPTVHLRRGESLRRYLEPGLEDGKTFVFWGRNYNAGGIRGPERDRAWVNQPRRCSTRRGHRRQAGAGALRQRGLHVRADFADGSYKEGVIDEGPDHLTFEFYTPYVIGATPANDKTWGVYDARGTNGLVVTCATNVKVSVSTDQGTTWHESGTPASAGVNRIDLTDHVKGHNQYQLRFGAGASALKDAKPCWRTVCQANVATIPRLHDGTNQITFLAGGTALRRRARTGPRRSRTSWKVRWIRRR
jgi:hypothetical protein